jgi:hypothetical protein
MAKKSKVVKDDVDSKLKRKEYEAALRRLQEELCALQAWVKTKGLRVIVLFEGETAPGKEEPSAPSQSASARGCFASLPCRPLPIGKKAKCTCSGTCSISQRPARS